MENPISKMEWIRKVMAFKLTRVLLMIGFFLFVYQILYAIGVFFAINTMVLSMWMCWLAMIVVFVSILPVRNALFYVKRSPEVIPASEVVSVSEVVPVSETIPSIPPIEKKDGLLHF